MKPGYMNRSEAVKHLYKCQQCGLIVEGEAKGMKHERLFAHRMDFIIRPDTGDGSIEDSKLAKEIT